MITKFKLFENNRIVFDNNSCWVIYGNKRQISNILTSILNDNIIKEYNIKNRIRQIINMIEVSISRNSQDIIGMFLYHTNDDLSISSFRDNNEKEYSLKTYYKDVPFKGELKLNYFGSVIIDTTEADVYKYNL
jgi:hypothetical protein